MQSSQRWNINIKKKKDQPLFKTTVNIFCILID